MRHLAALLLAVITTLSLPSAAHAWPSPPATLEVQNHTPFDVTVLVDGDLRGAIRANDQRGFGVWPGVRQVQVVSQSGNLALLDARVDARPHTATPVIVTPPMVHVSLINDGEAPVYVQVERERRGLWLLPGGVHAVERPMGRLQVSTQLYTFEGLVPLDTFVLDLFPGRPVRQSVGYTPRAAMAPVTLTNREHSTLSVWVDGVLFATLRSRETQALALAPGRHLIAVIDHHGRLLYQSPAVLGARTSYDVVFANGVTVTPRRLTQSVAWSR